MTTDTVVDFDSAQDNLAASLPGYERREKQASLAHKIESQIRGEGASRHALLQASTGTGKSLAYLIPAILSGKKVVVSTATKALQDQIANKDLPFLAEHLGVSFTHSILKGRSNYLCKAELARLAEDDPKLAAKITAKLADIETEAGGIFPAGFYAEETDLDVTPVEFRKVTCSSGDCPGKNQCPFGKECFSEFAKADAKAASVVVVNHALLCTDLWLAGITGGKASMLGDYEVLIVDEAHELTDYATNVWGTTLREHTLISLSEEATNFFGKIGSKDAREFARQSDNYTVLVRDLWTKLEVGRLRFTDIIELGDDLVQINSALVDMKNLVQAQGQRIDTGERDAKSVASLKGSYNRLVRRFGNACESIAALVTADDENVKFVEEETKKYRGKTVTTKVIQALPVEMGEILNRVLWADNRVCENCNGTGTEENLKVCFRCNGSGHKVNITSLLLSATLTTDGGSFAYVAGQLGLPTFETFDVGTPFDFQKQAQLYIPSHLPEPTPANREVWGSMSIAEIGDLINASDGRALILFTSTKQMKAAYDHLSPRLPYTCLVQGNGTNKELARIFTEDEHSVLFATKSFMTGVDFQGSTCSLVVIDKLPFAVPTDPIVEARCELIEKRGGNTFAEFTVPMMTLILQQAFGRLIRHGDDAGVVAILDRRLTTKGYGKKIVASLPDAPLVQTIEEVQSFYAKAAA